MWRIKKRTGLHIKRSWVRITAALFFCRRWWKYTAAQNMSFSIKSTVKFYSVFDRGRAQFSNWYRSCPIDILLDNDISLYSDLNVLSNKNRNDRTVNPHGNEQIKHYSSKCCYVCKVSLQFRKIHVGVQIICAFFALTCIDLACFLKIACRCLLCESIRGELMVFCL